MDTYVTCSCALTGTKYAALVKNASRLYIQPLHLSHSNLALAARSLISRGSVHFVDCQELYKYRLQKFCILIRAF